MFWYVVVSLRSTPLFLNYRLILNIAIISCRARSIHFEISCSWSMPCSATCPGRS
jgi:hypothetical protein